MVSRVSGMALALFLGFQSMAVPARAENPMGYRLLTAEQAASLPRAGGTLGLDVGRAQQMNDGGMTFDILRVNAVRSGSAGARAGFKVGDQIIAVDGTVFPTVATFAAYIGSRSPGQQITADYIPAGGGPENAQRLGVRLGGGPATASAPPAPPAEASQGLSTGTKIAIGVAAAALFGCYKMGCFSHKSKAAPGALPAPQR